MEIQAASTTTDNSGTVVRTWSNVAERWGSFSPASATEQTQAEQIESQITGTVEMRYYDGLSNRHRLLYPKSWTNLAAAITTTDGVSITVDSATGFPPTADLDYIIRVDDEFMIVTDGQGTTTWTVTRGAFGSTPATHLDARPVAFMAVLNIDSPIDPDNRHKDHIITCTEVDKG